MRESRRNRESRRPVKATCRTSHRLRHFFAQPTCSHPGGTPPDGLIQSGRCGSSFRKDILSKRHPDGQNRTRTTECQTASTDAEQHHGTSKSGLTGANRSNLNSEACHLGPAWLGKHHWPNASSARSAVQNRLKTILQRISRTTLSKLIQMTQRSESNTAGYKSRNHQLSVTDPAAWKSRSRTISRPPRQRFATDHPTKKCEHNPSTERWLTQGSESLDAPSVFSLRLPPMMLTISPTAS